MYMKDEKIVEIDDYRLELENRIRNLLWTISGDYTLNMKVDVSLYLRSKAIALYDGIKQGALAKYYDRNLLGLYLVKKVFCQAGEGELTAVAQLCVEEAIGDKICQERPGVREMQKEAFEDILDQEFERMPAYGDILGRLKIAILRDRLQNGNHYVEERLRKIRAMVYKARTAADTIELIRIIDSLYNTIIDPNFEKDHGTLEQVMAVTMEELTEYDWEDFLTEELYEEALESYIEQMTNKITDMEDTAVTEEMEKQRQTKHKITILTEEELEKAYTYVEKGKFKLIDKPKPTLLEPTDAIVKITLGSICTSDLHIKHGSVPRAVVGVTIGHEMVGIVEEVGKEVTKVKKGDRVTVNVETFCGECYFCKHGYVNNCTDENGGWALGCRIDGGQAEYVRVPLANQGLNKIPDNVTDRKALFVGDILATGYWAIRISEIKEDDTVLIIGAGPTGICTLICALLKKPKRIIVCEKDESRINFIKKHYPGVLTVKPEDCLSFVKANSDHHGADVVLEVAGSDDTFALAWKAARPNAIVTVVALYNNAQTLPLPDMYGKNLTFKFGGVDGCDCDETLKLISEGKINTEDLITHTYPLDKIDDAYDLFENKRDGVIKVAIEC